jgi:hypothetical protein
MPPTKEMPAALRMLFLQFCSGWLPVMSHSSQIGTWNPRKPRQDGMEPVQPLPKPYTLVP